MQVTINGETKEITSGLNIATLMAELGIEPGQVAVEKNGEIVPKSTHVDTQVETGDTIEIVRFIGGG